MFIFTSQPYPSHDENIANILKAVNDISEHTDSWSTPSSTLVTILSIMASAATVIGVIVLYWEFRKRKTTKECQRRIILDLIRHLFVNNAIIEVIRSKSQHYKYTYRPQDGVFSRFATLSTDTDLGRLAVTARNFDDIHELSLLLRNYNIVSELAEKHFADKNYPVKEKERDLKDLFERSMRITELLLKLAETQKLKIGKETVVKYLKECYEKDTQQTQKPKGFVLLKRDCFKDHDYYDKLGLKELFDGCIFIRVNRITFINYF